MRIAFFVFSADKEDSRRSVAWVWNRASDAMTLLVSSEAGSLVVESVDSVAVERGGEMGRVIGRGGGAEEEEAVVDVPGGHAPTYCLLGDLRGRGREAEAEVDEDGVGVGGTTRESSASP